MLRRCLAQQLVVTQIDAEFEGDAFAPVLDTQWRESQRDTHISSQGMHYSFVTYLKTSTR
jgi:dihydrofolate reductase